MERRDSGAQGRSAATLAADKRMGQALLGRCHGPRIDAYREALAAGGDPDFEIPGAMSALCLSALDGDLIECALLLEAGADPEKAMPSGFTPLMMAAHAGRADCVELLLGAGADPSAMSVQGESAMWLACLASAGSGGNEAALPLLMAGAHPDSGGLWGRKAVHEAAWRDDSTLLAALLEAGAKADVADEEGVTPLMEAARCGNKRSAMLLLGGGVDIEAADEDGITALMDAAMAGSAAGVALLLELGADLDRKCRSGACALELAKGEARAPLLAAWERRRLSEDTSFSVSAPSTPVRRAAL